MQNESEKQELDFVKEEVHERLEQLGVIRETIRTSGVSRVDVDDILKIAKDPIVVTLEKGDDEPSTDVDDFMPEVGLENFPVHLFTEDRSSFNKEVALEGIVSSTLATIKRWIVAIYNGIVRVIQAIRRGWNDAKEKKLTVSRRELIVVIKQKLEELGQKFPGCDILPSIEKAREGFYNLPCVKEHQLVRILSDTAMATSFNEVLEGATAQFIEMAKHVPTEASQVKTSEDLLRFCFDNEFIDKLVETGDTVEVFLQKPKAPAKFNIATFISLLEKDNDNRYKRYDDIFAAFQELQKKAGGLGKIKFVVEDEQTQSNLIAWLNQLNAMVSQASKISAATSKLRIISRELEIGIIRLLTAQLSTYFSFARDVAKDETTAREIKKYWEDVAKVL